MSRPITESYGCGLIASGLALMLFSLAAWFGASFTDESVSPVAVGTAALGAAIGIAGWRRRLSLPRAQDQ